MNHEKIMRSIHHIFDPELPRLAPGDAASTRRALESLLGPDLEKIGPGFRSLDIGCGNGSQTLRLAAETGCPVMAVDNHQPYLDVLERRARQQGHGGLIETLCADMTTLDLGDRLFDLVWAEGSAFVMGIGPALKAWREFLKPGGCLGFTELTWFAEGAPEECRDFFAKEYPPMADVATNLSTIKECGFDLVDHFPLPESSWLVNFYDPLEKRMKGYQSPWDDDEERAVKGMVDMEIKTYRKHSRWYGYTFFLLRKKD